MNYDLSCIFTCSNLFLIVVPGEFIAVFNGASCRLVAKFRSSKVQCATRKRIFFFDKLVFDENKNDRTSINRGNSFQSKLEVYLISASEIQWRNGTPFLKKLKGIELCFPCISVLEPIGIAFASTTTNKI